MVKTKYYIIDITMHYSGLNITYFRDAVYIMIFMSSLRDSIQNI